MLFFSCRSYLHHDSSLNTNVVAVDSDNDEVADVEEDDDIIPTKRLHLQEIKDQTSRYLSDFVELGQIGSGEFGSVFKCINRLDGCVYALKRSRKPIKGTLIDILRLLVY